MRKFLLYTSAVMVSYSFSTLSMTAYAAWDQRSLEAQTQGSVYLRAKIEKLEKENEALRNSINQMRAQHQASNKTQNRDYSYDTRIQALIEENKRLVKILERRNISNGNETDLYTLKIEELKKENSKLMERVSSLSKKLQGQMQADREVGSTYTSMVKEIERLKNALTQKTASNKQLEALQREVYLLKEKNADLQVIQKNDVLESRVSREANIEQKKQEIANLQRSLSELREENRTLAKALADSSEKSLQFQEKAVGATRLETENLREIARLRNNLVDLKQKNYDLEQKLSQAKIASDKTRLQEEVDALKNQNASLRDTISAQSKVLVSSDNAGQTAERLISENKALRRQLNESDNAIKANAKSAQDVMAKYQELQLSLKQKEKYIRKLEEFKKKAVELDQQKSITTKHNLYDTSEADIAGSNKIQELQLENQSLQKALKKEREGMIAYRSKIREYQDELKSLKDALAAGALQPKEMLLNKTVEMDKSKDDARYVETSYPPVEKVLPLLDTMGERIKYNPSLNQEEIKAEDLLSKELKPLSGN